MGAARIQSGDLDGQGFSSYVAALLMLIDPISHLTTNFNEFQQGQASLKRLREIEREAVEQPDRPDAQPLGGSPVNCCWSRSALATTPSNRC